MIYTNAALQQYIPTVSYTHLVISRTEHTLDENVADNLFRFQHTDNMPLDWDQSNTFVQSPAALNFLIADTRLFFRSSIPADAGGKTVHPP